MLTKQINIWKERFDFLKSDLSFAFVRITNKAELEVIQTSIKLTSLIPDHVYPFSDIIFTEDLGSTVHHFQNINDQNKEFKFKLKDNYIPFNRVHSLSHIVDEATESIWVFGANRNNEQSDVLAAASHDLRSPIISILGLANIMELMLEAKKVDLKEMLSLTKVIKLSCSDALDFTNDILEMSNIESKSDGLKLEQVSMNEFITRYINTHRLIPLKKAIKVQFVSEVAEDDLLSINKTKVTRVFDNLLSNAVKFSHRGSIIEIKLEKNTTSLVVYFSDHGIGMSEDMLQSIFIKFGKSRRQGLSGEKSHGLGMSIVKQIMELHGGSLSVKSQEGSGTEIKLTFNKN